MDRLGSLVVEPPVSFGGTKAYDEEEDLPPLVADAVGLARNLGFELSCLPQQGRLIHVLAGGRQGGCLGETGTGAGVGLAWMASAVDDRTRLVSVERNGELVAAVRDLFRPFANVTVLHGDWTVLAHHRPFDLLVLDGGGQGKGGPPIDPGEWLVPAGCVVVDDLTPMTSWPPLWEGRPDPCRLHWFGHPEVLVTEVRVTPEVASLVGIRRG